jgi:hypothetical protein
MHAERRFQRSTRRRLQCEPKLFERAMPASESFTVSVTALRHPGALPPSSRARSEAKRERVGEKVANCAVWHHLW